MFSLAHAMCRTAATIGIGDYAPEARDHGLGRTCRQRAKSNRTMNQNSLIGRFKPILSWVGWKSGRVVHVMDESGTTRTCSECDYVVPDGIAPGIKAWTCPACGYRHIRDENAAKNGLDRLKHFVEAASGNPHSPRSGPTGPRNRVVQRCGWSFVSSGKPGGAWRVLDESTTSVNEIAPAPFRRRRSSGSAAGSGLDSGGPDRLESDRSCSMKSMDDMICAG